jgi:TP901 family phage tail tape measure protein
VADRSVVVRLRAEIAEFRRQMGEAADVVEKNRQSVDTLSNQAGLMGAAMVAGALVSVRAWANFDEAMSHVESATHSTTQTMDALTQAALEAGKTTKFSATEAAGGIEELAKAGVAAEDIIGGGLTGALNLAAAGGLAVEESAEIAATALKTFGLEGSQVEHVADLMAAGAGKAQGSVHQLGMALKQSALVANSTGLTIEETSAALASFASAGLLGSDAGTSFKSMLQRLTPQSQEAQKAMDALGISAYDSQGQFIGLGKFAGNLQDSLKGLTDEQRNSALATIFGSDAVRAANVLYNEGAAGVARWTDAVNDTGYAAETARLRLDNLKGDLTTLKGAFENAMIGMGSTSDSTLRGMVQNLTEVIRQFSELPGEVQGATLAFVGAGGLVLLGVAGLGKLTVAINNTRVALRALEISGRAAGAAVGAIGLAVAAGAFAFAKWAEDAAKARQKTEEFLDTLDEVGNQTDATVRKLTDNLSNEKLGRSFGEWVMGDDPTSALEFARKIGVGFKDMTGYILEDADAIKKVNAALQEYEARSGNQGKGGNGTGVAKSTAEDQTARFTELLGRERDALTEAERAAALKGQANEELGVTEESAAAAADKVTVAMQEQAVTMAELLEMQREMAGEVLSVRDAENQFEASVDAAAQALADNGATLDVTTEKGRANRSALDDIAESGWDLVESMEANGSTQEELQGTMQATRDRFIEAAIQFGMTGDEAAALADQFKLIPKDVKTTATIDAAQARDVAAEMRAKYDGLGRPINTVMSLSLNSSAFDRALSDRQAALAAAGGNGGGGFASGGWTGDMSPTRVAGVVHGREFVVKAGPASTHRAELEAMNAGRYAAAPSMGPVSSSSSGGTVVSLEGTTVVLQVGEREFTGYVAGVADARVVAGIRTATSGRGTR